MARPRTSDWQLLKRTARYLVEAPRYKQRFCGQSLPARVDVFTDTNWAGCNTTCRSSSGGAMLWGGHCIKTRARIQATVALSSAEAPLHALIKSLAQGLGITTLFVDLVISVPVSFHAGASAAFGMG